MYAPHPTMLYIMIPDVGKDNDNKLNFLQLNQTSQGFKIILSCMISLLQSTPRCRFAWKIGNDIQTVACGSLGLQEAL